MSDHNDMSTIMNARERIIDLVNQIQVARTHVQQLEAELDALLPSGRGGRPPAAALAVATSAGAAPRKRGRRARAGSLASRVIELLESAPGEAFGVPDVAERLGVSNIRSLRATVLRLASGKKIRRQQRGRYQAAASNGRRRAARRR